MAGKDHGNAGREGRVEGDELSIQRDLYSRERFWGHLCRRDRRIRRRFRRQPCPSKIDQSLPTHELRTLTAHGVRNACKPPKHEFVRRDRLDEAL